MKTRFIFILLFCPLLTYANSNDSIPGLFLLNSKIKAKRKDTVTIAGINRQVEKFIVTSQVRVQTLCDWNGSGRWEVKSNSYAIYSIADTSCEYLDSVYSEIKQYWKVKEEWSDKYAIHGNFSTLGISTGFLKRDSLIVPYISTEHQREGAYTIIWLKGQVYKIVLTHAEGWGALDSFIEQNVRFDTTAQVLREEYIIKQLDETKKLLENKITCP